MKKIFLIIFALLLGCTKAPSAVQEPAEPTEKPKTEVTEPMKAELDAGYVSPNLRIIADENRQLSFRVALQRVPEDRDVFDIMTDSTYFWGSDFVAYYCQENGFFGEVRYHVTVLENGQKIGDLYSESFTAGDYFPEREKLTPGKDFDIETVRSFNYSGSGMMMQHNFSFSILSYGEERTYSANWFDDKGKNHSVERSIKDPEWQILLDYVKKGEVCRRYVFPPDLVMLDGSETSFGVQWEGETPAEESFYRFQPSEQTEEELIDWLKSLAH